MGKFTTSLKRALLSGVAFVAFAVSANAGATYSGHYTTITTNPTGKGKVYVSDKKASDPSTIEYKDEAVIKFVSSENLIYVYAQPATGWKLAGYAYGAFNEETAEFDYDYSYLYKGNPAELTVSSSVTDDPDYSGTSDSTKVVELLKKQLDPTSSYQAVFTHVTVATVEGLDILGSATIDKLANDVNDVVTIEAIPNTESNQNCKFANWTVDGKVVSTDAQLTITVKDTATYVAHFTADNAKTIDFGEGKYLPVYPGDVTRLDFTTNVKALYFISDSCAFNSVDGDDNSIKVLDGAGAPAMNATILYGKGEAIVVTSPEEYGSVNDTYIGAWAKEESKVADLDPNHQYYTFDTNNAVFNKLDASGIIAADQFYLALPDSAWKKQSLTAAPAKINLNNPLVVNAISNVVAAPAAVKKGIYTIDGVRVARPEREGLYVIDGKKVLYRKK